MVVSDLALVDSDLNTTISLDGLQNVSRKINVFTEPIRTKFQSRKQQYDDEATTLPKNPVLQDNEMTFAETLSLNSVTTDG